MSIARSSVSADTQGLLRALKTGRISEIMPAQAPGELIQREHQHEDRQQDRADVPVLVQVVTPFQLVRGELSVTRP